MSQSQEPSTTGTAFRGLRRSTSDRMLTGVCGGLAQQFGIDPLLVRLGFILLTLAGSTGLVLYLLLWLIVPVEGSNEALGHRLPFPGRRAASPK